MTDPEELDGPAVSALGVRLRKLSKFSISHRMGDQNLLYLLHTSEGTLSRWSRLHLQSLALRFQGELTSGKQK
jgi:hypothetical protein